MESPRIIQDDKVDLPTETSDRATDLVSEILPVDASKISQDTDFNNAKAINHENSRILQEASPDVQDLSETTKSDRKSTGEAEETQSQQAQQVKTEEDNVERPKSSDNEAVENLTERREAEEAPQEVHQSSESQENISQENDENKETNKSEPELKEEEEKVEDNETQVQEKAEEQIQEPHVDNNNIVEENNEVPQSEDVGAEVDQRDNEVKQEQNVVNTEVQNEDKQEEQPAVESQVVEEPQNEQVSESKVENLGTEEKQLEEQNNEVIQPIEEIVQEKEAHKEEVQPVVEEQNNEVIPSEEIKPSVQEVEPVAEQKSEEQNNEIVQAPEEVKEIAQEEIVVQASEEIKPIEEPVVEQKAEDQNNQVVQALEEVVLSEENQPSVQEAESVAEQKSEEQNNEVIPSEEIKPSVEEAEPVVEQKSEEQNKENVQAPEEVKEIAQEEIVVQAPEEVKEIAQEEIVVQASDEIKPVEEPVIEQKVEEQNNQGVQKEEAQTEENKPVGESNKQQGQGVFFNEDIVQKENAGEAVEPKNEEEDKAPVVEEPLKETRSPKIKNLRINTNQNTVVTRIINYCGKTGEALPDATVAEPEKKAESPEEKSGTNPSESSGGSPPQVTKHFANQSLTDLLKPINMEEPQASPVIKRNATSTACIANPSQEEAKEEGKEAQQPASAMIASTKTKLTMEDFQKITSLGRGSYGEVFLVKKIANNKLYALKSIDKNFMKKEKKEHQVYVEREVLMKLNHPNIIKLVSSFQDKTKLYFVLEYVSGGEFSDYLRVQGKLTKDQIIFFSAEIINILEYLHTFGIAHRDMKPENLLLTAEGHIKCIDFGTARFLGNDKRTADLYNIKKGEDTLEANSSVQKKNHRSTFVGTAQYVSPEMLEGSDCGAPADLWALGCMVYLMTVGQFPFIDMNEYLIFQKIKAASVKYPEDMDSDIKDLIQRLLVKEPNERLGAGEKDSVNDYKALRGHPLFKNIDFANLNEQRPPVIEIASPHKKKSHDLHPTGTSNVGVQNRKTNSEDLSQPEAIKTSQAFNFQVENKVKNILSGLVLKKCGWLFYKPRQLILNNKPRLVYYDPDSNQLKGEIPLAPTTKAELESKTKFIVTCPNKKFVFKEMEHSAEKWVEIINKTVEQLYAKKPDQ